MKKIILTITLSIQFSLYGQNDSFVGFFSDTIIEINGDLNKDGILDKVYVIHDTQNIDGLYLLQIYFQDQNKKLNFIVSSKKLIEPKNKFGSMGNELSEVTIKNNILIISYQLTRGHYEHKFRYQNGNFELIGYSFGISDGLGVINNIDFNLSTGVRIEKNINYETNEIISVSKKKKIIRPLPKLQEFNINDNEIR